MSLGYMPKGAIHSEESVSPADTPVKGAGTFCCLPNGQAQTLQLLLGTRDVKKKIVHGG